MRRQYLAIKKQLPDTILFFRLGDFYETFDRDAELVAEVCDVVLTSRPVGKNERVPLAGVPYHSVEPHIAKLVAAGYKVAIAEQRGNTPPPGEKLVERAVRRVVTAGTIVEPGLLEEGRNNYLAAIAWDAAPSGQPLRAGLAYTDITTGEFAATQLEGSDPAALDRRLREEMARLQPVEVLVAEETTARRGQQSHGPGQPLPIAASVPISRLPAWQFEEYHIAGAAAATPADVLDNPAYLVGKTPLVIVCRDGSLSAAIGGALAPKTERSIRYLSGGMIR